MPFDPALPTNGSPLSSVEMRGQLNALFDLIQGIPAGPPGPPGPPINGAGAGPTTTLQAHEPANVQVFFDNGVITFLFFIPQGHQGATGEQGLPGEVTAGQMDAAVTSALAGTSTNCNAVATLDNPFTSDPPTLADLEVLRAKLNELILALRR